MEGDWWLGANSKQEGLMVMMQSLVLSENENGTLETVNSPDCSENS